MAVTVIGMGVTRLERLRKDKGISRPELARLSGVSERTLIRIERNAGYEPGVFAMDRIARALGTNVDDLLEEQATVEAGE